jgi:hypothetical protein
MTRLDDERRVLSPSWQRTLTGAAGLSGSRAVPLSLLNRLVRAGLAPRCVEREERGDEEIKIVRVKIMDAVHKWCGSVSSAHGRGR